MTRVKICGLTREEDVDAVVDAGADAVGFISGIASSPRNLSISRAASLISRIPPFVTPVLVTSGQALVENSDAVKRIAPKAIQLYGSLFSAETVRSTFHAYLLKPFPVSRQEGDGGGADALAKAKEAVKGYDALLTDTYQKGVEGGTGLTSDWSMCEAIRKTIAPTPLILSGGLRPENMTDEREEHVNAADSPEECDAWELWVQELKSIREIVAATWNACVAQS